MSPIRSVTARQPRPATAPAHAPQHDTVRPSAGHRTGRIPSAVCRAWALAASLGCVGAAATPVATLLSAPEDPYVLDGQADGASSRCDISGDGLSVVFQSSAENLVESDTNLATDVFLATLSTGAVERINGYAGGYQNAGGAEQPSIDHAARYVAFVSTDPLALEPPGAPPATRQVYVLDRDTGTVTLASRGLGGLRGNAHSDQPAMAGDVPVVVFRSDATNLVPGDTNAAADIFRYDLASATLTRVSTDSAGAQAATAWPLLLQSDAPRISDDGDVVAFESTASNLVFGDGNWQRDVFVKVVSTGVTSRVSLGAFGQLGSAAFLADLSGDGTRVAFWSRDPILLPDDAASDRDLFLRDRVLGYTQPISVSSAGAAVPDADAFQAALDHAGETVVFSSSADFAIGQLRPDSSWLYRKDLRTGQVTAWGETMDLARESRPRLDHSGRVACFETNIVRVYDAHESEVLISDLRPGALALPYRIAGTVEALPVYARGGSNWLPEISADGDDVVFAAYEDLLDADAPLDGHPSGSQILHLDATSGELTLLSTGATGRNSIRGAHLPRISANGRYVAYESGSDDLVSGDDNDEIEPFLHDLERGTTHRLLEGFAPDAWSVDASVADGGRVVFRSAASNLLAVDTNGVEDVFLWDRRQGLSLISRSSSGAVANGASSSPRFSADGSSVVFASSATNLVAGDTNAADDVFVRNVAAGTTERISVSATGAEANGPSRSPSLSHDGRLVAFVSSADNLVASDGNGVDDIFLVDRDTAAVTRVTRGLGALGLSQPHSPRLAGQGGFVLFRAEDAAGLPQLVRYHVAEARHEVLLSADPAGGGAVWSPPGHAISADGQRVVVAWGDGLVEADVQPDSADVYLLTGMR